MIRVSVLLVVFFLHAIGSNGQKEVALLDSLIGVNAFPVLFLDASGSLDELHERRFRKVYTYKRGNGKSDVAYMSTNRRESHIAPSFFESSNVIPYGDSNAHGIAYVPPVHLAFVYARTFRRKSEGYKHMNFFVDHFVQNYGDSNWGTSKYRCNIRLFEGDSLVLRLRFGPSPPGGKFQGMISTGRNQLDLLGHFEMWNTFNPRVYRYSIEVLNERGDPYEHYSDNIGFRDVRLIKDKVLINNYPVNFKTVRLQSNELPADSLTDYLRLLKVHNVNTVLLEGIGTKKLFEFCDSAGLYVVQVVGDDTFNTLQELLEFFVRFKGHPSFIAWMDVGLDTSWSNILTRLDRHRLMFKGQRLLYPIINSWNSMDSTERAELKNRFQTFALYYVPATSVLRVQLREPFQCIGDVGIRWRFENDGLIIDEGFLDSAPNKAGLIEISIPTRVNAGAAGFAYYFEVTVKEDCNPYRTGDVVGLAKFRYIIKDDQLVYLVDY
jgi:hypothetical protein